MATVLSKAGLGATAATAPAAFSSGLDPEWGQDDAAGPQQEQLGLE